MLLIKNAAIVNPAKAGISAHRESGKARYPDRTGQDPAYRGRRELAGYGKDAERGI